MALYLVTYASEKPKTGHKPIFSMQVVEAGSRSTAMRLVLLSCSGDIWQIQADYAGHKILRAE